MTDLKEEFWDRMEDVRSAMVSTSDSGKMVPMSPKADEDFPGKIWFITAKGTDLARSTSNGAQQAQMVVSDDGQGLYAHVTGTLAPSQDERALDEVWGFVADAWFEGGKHDPDVCLLCFTPQEAEVSVTSTSSAKFLYEMAKANVSGETPDLGKNGLIVF